jgi:poly-gamma-glutamate capsule biosynthesis protein CapA/YwtB (metallophosphatase superfamily)
MNSQSKIILFGDICPTKDTLSLFENGDSKNLFNDLLEEMQASDFVAGNLEFVLSDSPKSIKKAGPVLSAKKKCINVLKQANFKLLSLANNHIKDCGEEGVASTLDSCKAVSIATLGAAENLKKSKESYITTVNGVRIGWLAFAEQEFNTASVTEYGANYFDPYEDLDLIEQTKTEVDYLIVIYHGGVEYYPYPSPQLKKKCRKFIDKGADLVTCQHSHCIGTIDNYKDKKIIYGQGNSVFGFRENDVSWNQGLLVELIWNNQVEAPQIKLVPIEATRNGIRKMQEFAGLKILETVDQMSSKIEDDQFLEKEWLKFCKQKQSLYFPFYFGYNRILIHLNRITNNGLVKLFYPKSKLRTSHNIIRCESHNEVIQSLFKEHIER